MLRYALTLTLPLLLGGCFSTLVHLDGQRCLYPGTRLGWNMATDKPTAGWPLLVDVPFSFVLDTVLLPWDFTAYLPDGAGGDHAHVCNLDGGLDVM